MRVIGFVGLPGSGKSEAASVARELDIPVVTMGDVIRRACRDRGFDPESYHGEMAQTLREEGGPAAIAEESIPLIESSLESSDVVIVDGIRSDVEVERFEDAFGDDFTLVRVEAPFELRADRIDARDRDDTAAESLQQRDERELGFGMGDAMERADVTLENTESLETFHDRVRDFLT